MISQASKLYRSFSLHEINVNTRCRKKQWYVLWQCMTIQTPEKFYNIIWLLFILMNWKSITLAWRRRQIQSCNSLCWWYWCVFRFQKRRSVVFSRMGKRVILVSRSTLDNDGQNKSRNEDYSIRSSELKKTSSEEQFNRCQAEKSVNGIGRVKVKIAPFLALRNLK